MLKLQLIVATTILAGQVSAADQALTIKLQYSEGRSSVNVEHSTQLFKRAGLDADKRALNCQVECAPYFESEKTCRAQGKGDVDPNTKLTGCQCQKGYIENVIACASCDPTIAKRVSMEDDKAAATYMGSCSCHNNGAADAVSLESLPGSASEQELKDLQVCPTNRDMESSTKSSTAVHGLPGLRFTITMTFAVIGAWSIL